MARKIGVVMPFRHNPEEPERTDVARFVLENIKGAGLKSVVVEQVGKLPPKNLSSHRNIVLNHDGPFWKTKLLNMGAHGSDFDAFFFHDADMLLPKHCYDLASELIELYDAVKPYNMVVDLTKKQSENLLKGETPNVGYGQIREGINITGGVILMRRETWLNIGCWEESFIGWGAEDDVQSFKLMRGDHSFKELEYQAFHIWHPRTPESTNKNEHYKKNIEHMNKIMDMLPDEMEIHCRANASRYK